MKVTQHDPKWLALLPMWFLSIMESSLTHGASRNSSQVQQLKCEYSLHTPSRHHHTCGVRPPCRRPGYANSRGFATNTRIREDSRGFARIREDSRGFARIIEKFSQGFARSSRRIRKFADRVREDSRPVNDTSPSLIRVGTWLGHPYQEFRCEHVL